MAITKELVNDRIEIVNQWSIQVRCASVIKEDGKELTRSFHRKVLHPWVLDKDGNTVEADISGEGSDVQRHCNAAWTDQIKADYKAFLLANKPS